MDQFPTLDRAIPCCQIGSVETFFDSTSQKVTMPWCKPMKFMSMYLGMELIYLFHKEPICVGLLFFL